VWIIRAAFVRIPKRLRRNSPNIVQILFQSLIADASGGASVQLNQIYGPLPLPTLSCFTSRTLPCFAVYKFVPPSSPALLMHSRRRLPSTMHAAAVSQPLLSLAATTAPPLGPTFLASPGLVFRVQLMQSVLSDSVSQVPSTTAINVSMALLLSELALAAPTVKERCTPAVSTRRPRRP
jgi:hypothetical protein